jgi:hypothetical protein
MSPEMQRYVIYLLGQLENRKAVSGDIVNTTKNVEPIRRVSTSSQADPKSPNIHSESGVHEPHYLANSISNNPTTSLPHIATHSDDHWDPKPSTVDFVTNKAQTNSQKSPNHIMEVPPVAGMLFLPHCLLNTFSKHGSLTS